MQTDLGNKKLDIVTEVPRAGGRIGFLSKSGFLYRRTTGAVKALVPILAKTYAEEWGVEAKPDPVLESVEWGDVPPNYVLGILYHHVLKDYDREVLVWHAVNKEGEWAIGVPEQEGSSGFVEIKDGDDVGTDLVEAGYRITGTTHIHPGAWVGYSHTDEETFVENPGLHCIISRDGKVVGIHASVHGAVWTLDNGREVGDDFPEGKTIKLFTSEGRELKDLLHVRTWSRPTVQNNAITKYNPQDRRIPQWDLDDMIFDDTHNCWVSKEYWLSKQLRNDRGVRPWERYEHKRAGIAIEDVVVAYDPVTDDFRLYDRSDVNALALSVDEQLTADVLDLLWYDDGQDGPTDKQLADEEDDI